MDQIREKYSFFNVYKSVIESSKYIRESQVMQQDLFTYNAKSTSWEQYNQLATEIMTA